MADWKRINGEFKNIDSHIGFEFPNEYLEDRYIHVSYLISDDKNYNENGEKVHDHDEVPMGSRNRWSFFKFYHEKPDVTPCDGRACGNSIAGISANFRIKLADSPHEQSNLTVENPYPENEESSVGFGVSLGAGIPFTPVSAGVGISPYQLDDSKIDVDSESYHYTEWDLTLANFCGHPCEPIPDDQENAAGVHFDFVAGNDTETRTFDAEAGFSWYITRQGRGGIDRIYSENDSQEYNNLEVDIVSPNYA